MNFIRATATYEGGQTILTGSGFRLALPAARSSEAISGAVQIGIRPEELDGPCAAGENTIPLKVSVREHLGHTLLAYGYIDDVQIVASLDPHSQLDVDSEINLLPNLHTLHVFDPTSEETRT